MPSDLIPNAASSKGLLRASSLVKLVILITICNELHSHSHSHSLSLSFTFSFFMFRGQGIRCRNSIPVSNKATRNRVRITSKIQVKFLLRGIRTNTLYRVGMYVSNRFLVLENLRDKEIMIVTIFITPQVRCIERIIYLHSLDGETRL